MEIDVTPDGNSEKSGSTSSHGEEEILDNITEDPLDVSNIISSISKEHEKNTRTNNRRNAKHALRQQAKRRRKNTTIASGNSSSVPRIIVKPLPPQTVEEVTVTTVPTIRTPTMREVLASIPGFTMKPRKRTNKKLSTAAQLEQTKEGCIDLETPDSILVNTNLRHLLNKATFAALPLLYQNKLVQLLPSVDRHIVTNSIDPSAVDINNSGLNNEFFARACLEWQDRLAEGEFTPENQQKIKLEADKERNKVDPWKLKHFEPIWGDRSITVTLDPSVSSSSVNNALTSNRPPIKTTIKLRPSTTSLTNKLKSSAPLPVKRPRTVGAMTRSCTSMKVSETFCPDEILVEIKTPPIPDLLPIKQIKQVQKEEVQPKSESIVKVDLVDIIPSPSDYIVELQEKCIVNISETILKNNEETIIICPSKPQKRRRSESETESEHQMPSPKRKTPSPVPNSPVPEEILETVHATEKEDIEEMNEMIFETPSDDDKASIATSESASEIIMEEDNMCDFEKDKLIDENSSSLTTTNIEEISSNETIETVDSLQLHVDYKDDMNQTDETSSTTTTTTDNKSDQDEQEETMTSTPDIIDMAPMETDPLQITENDNSESNLEEDKVYNIAAQVINEHEIQNISETENQLTEINGEVHTVTIAEDNAEQETVLEVQMEDTFQILPNALILQQDSMVTEMVTDNLTDNPSCSESCETDGCIADSAEKLVASVEECDLVQLSQTNFENVETIREDVDEDRFIDAENYVLESGQISTSEPVKMEERSQVDIQATLFGENVSRGEIYFFKLFY